MVISIDDYEAYIESLTGYQAGPDDEALLEILEVQENQHILDYTHQDTLPSALQPVLKAHVVSMFFIARKKEIVVDGNTQVVTAIKEGDVQVNLKVDSDEQRLDCIIAELSKEGDLNCFRRFTW